MSRIIIYPYKFASASAKALAETIQKRGYSVLRVHPDRKYSRRTTDVVLNWGSHTVPKWNHGEILNDIPEVVLAGDKLQSLQVLQASGVPTPEFTTDKRLAEAWLSADGSVVERKLLNASGGRGIVLHTKDSKGVGDAPLYTRYFKKRREYRVHVANGEVLDWQQKMNREGTAPEDINYQIRNHDNGWIYARDAAQDIPQYLLDISVEAVNALGLVFGAVDLGWNERNERGTVFEVNTAPGLTGEETLNSYANFVIDHYEDVN